MITKHVHQYIRVRPERKRADAVTWFKCSIIGCVHKIKKEFLEGRICRCYRCGLSFPIMKKHAEMERPHCDACTDSEKQRELNRLRDALENDLLKEIGEI